MKKFLRTCCWALNIALLASTAVSAQTNLISNGDFENRNQVPQVPDNIAPQPASRDDLRNWYRTTSTGSNHPSYVALDGGHDVNPRMMWDYFLQFKQDFSFIPHSSNSCVMLIQHDAPADHSYNSMITQPLKRPLLPGHTYQAGFWALRSVSGRYRTKLALWVTDGDPSYNHVRGTISPAIGSKIVESADDILSMKSWTYVSGIITIPEDETDNAWVTVGYDPQANQYYDPKIEELGTSPNHVSFIEYAIDDVSLVDITSTPCASLSKPTATQVATDDCTLTALFEIDKYDPSFKYSVKLSSNFTTSGYPVGQQFKVTCSAGNQGGGFQLIAYNPDCDLTIVSDDIGVAFGPCDARFGASRTTTGAYPNPAAEAITMPAGVESATLRNDKGRAVRQLTKTSRLDVQDLPDGLYNLQMMQDGKLINQRIQVKH